MIYIIVEGNRRISTRMPSHLISCPSSQSHVLICILLFILRGTSGATITFINSCDYTVWPGILSNAGSQGLGSTGFQLTTGTSRAFQAPAGWSGRFWGRTSCNFDSTGKGSCTTGDCASGQLECNGAGATPPATLAELAIGSGDGQDFYDVSLVDGYNLPVVMAAAGGRAGECAATGCVADLNRRCPPELRVGEGEACRSACDEFGRPEYCCSGAFSSPATCGPTKYSEVFKAACPKSYSYAYDDRTSTFTCKGADYVITFCPGSTSQKSTKDSSKTGEAGEGLGGVVPGKEHPSFLPGLIIAEGSRKMAVTQAAPFLSAIAVLVTLLA